MLTSGGIYSSAPAGRILLIPNISSRAVLLTTPVFMTLVAFKLGAEWLRSSEGLPAYTEEDDQRQVITDRKGYTNPSASQVSRLVLRISWRSSNELYPLS